MDIDSFEPELPENGVDLDEIWENWSNFETEYLGLLDPEGPSGRSMFAFIRRSLRQFHLETRWSEACILNETYLRAYALIVEKRKPIQVPLAWIRVTAYNVIMELSRDQRKLISIEENMLADWSRGVSATSHFDANSSLTHDLDVLRKAFQNLESEEQRLLNLKIIEGLSWREIRNYLALEGKECTEAALRKQKERALRKLRSIYHSLKPLSGL